MKVKTFWISMGLILFFHGCTTTTPEVQNMEIVAAPAKDQKIGFEETITSKKKNFVSLSPYTKLDFPNKTMFMLSIQNHGEEPIDISCDNISVTFGNNTENGSANTINVQTLNEVMNDFKNASRANELRFLETVVGPYECVVGVMLSEEEKWGYDLMPDYDEFDLRQGRIQLETMHEQNQQILEAMPDFIMSRQIIMPGDSYTGVVVCNTGQIDLTMEGTFEISVSIDGDEHIFAFNRSLAGSKQKEY